MFKILDGRKYFYQWDINRKLIVNDETIKEVHFCNRQNECSLVCEVYTENDLNVVDVPNIILQKNNYINVYAYDGESTRHSKTFLLKPRSKPEDYVYTETEIKNYETLKAYVDDEIKKVANSGGSGVPSEGITVDTQMSGTSENPVQNKVIKKYVDDIAAGVEQWSTEQHQQIERNIENFMREHLVLKQDGKGLSTNDFTDADKTKLDASVSQEYVDEKLEGFEGGSGSGGGISNRAINLLIDILKVGMFTTNVSGKIESLKETLLAGGGSSGGSSGDDDTPTTTDDITVTDGVMTIISVGSEVNVTDNIMTIF